MRSAFVQFTHSPAPPAGWLDRLPAREGEVLWPGPAPNDHGGEDDEGADQGRHGTFAAGGGGVEGPVPQRGGQDDAAM